MKNRNKRYFVALFCAAIAALVLPAASLAQSRYSNYSKRDVSGIIERLEQSSDEFRRDFDRYLNDSRNRNDDRAREMVENYENSLDRLRREFDRNDTWWQSRNNVQNVMRDARQVNRMMNQISFARQIERQWNNMRRDLNRLADTYELADLGGGGGGGGGGGTGGNVPNWAVGTFYGRNPQTGGPITLTINRNGSVTVVYENGITDYATLNGTRLYNNGAESRLSRINNGIRATSVDNRERIDYFRSGYGDGNTGGETGGDVPSWAVGTFVGRNPQTGGPFRMTINRNGSVTVVFENGTVNYATLNGDRLNNNGAVSRISRTRNGIRSTSLDNGETIDLRRQ